MICAYPLCQVKTTAKKSSFRLDTTSQTVSTNNSIEYCSLNCKNASTYYSFQLDTEPLFIRKIEQYKDVSLLDHINVVKRDITKVEKLTTDFSKHLNINEHSSICIKENFNPSPIEPTFNTKNTIEGFSPSQSRINNQLVKDIQHHPESKQESDEEEQTDMNPLTDSDQNSKSDNEYTQNWFQDDDQEDTKLSLSRFGKLWTFLDHLVTLDTKAYLQSHLDANHKMSMNANQTKIYQTRKSIFTTTLLNLFKNKERISFECCYS